MAIPAPEVQEQQPNKTMDEHGLANHDEHGLANYDEYGLANYDEYGLGAASAYAKTRHDSANESSPLAGVTGDGVDTPATNPALHAASHSGSAEAKRIRHFLEVCRDALESRKEALAAAAAATTTTAAYQHDNLPKPQPAQYAQHVSAISGTHMSCWPGPLVDGDEYERTAVSADVTATEQLSSKTTQHKTTQHKTTMAVEDTISPARHVSRMEGKFMSLWPLEVDEDDSS